jgi:hypothetical protein
VVACGAWATVRELRERANNNAEDGKLALKEVGEPESNTEWILAAV